jgi:hypothetical protein
MIRQCTTGNRNANARQDAAPGCHKIVPVPGVAGGLAGRHGILTTIGAICAFLD